MNVLVTGATGFVGRALCALLVRRGHELRGSTRWTSGMAAPGAGTTVAVGEIGPTTDWTAAVEGMDAVVHLAARVHMLEDTAAGALAEYRRTNVEGTRSLAAAALRAGVRRLVFLSSAKVHGERSVRPFTEVDAPHPEDAYAVSKLEAEEALKETLAGSQTQWTILRPPLVYGQGVRANFLRLLRVVARGVPLPLAGIDNRRSLIYVGNLVAAVEACLEEEGAGGRTWLVSDGEDLSTPELVRRLARALNRPARLVPVPVRLLRLAGALSGRAAAVDRLVDSLQVDATAIRAALQWTPAYTVDQGLVETACWFRAAQV
jgi:UDP-N-acetyl-alpha-D-quinovosamine dehydrogenase